MRYREKPTPVGGLFVFPPSYYFDESESQYTEICRALGGDCYKVVAVACGDTEEESHALAVRIAKFLSGEGEER